MALLSRLAAGERVATVGVMAGPDGTFRYEIA